MAANEETKSRSHRKGIHPLFHLAIALVLLALVQSFVIKPYAIPSASMEPTLMTGDRILVNRLAYVAYDPAPGDVVVFVADESWGPSPAESDSAFEYGLKWLGSIFGIGPGVDHNMAKRIIAVGGQTIECCDSSGNILVDASPIESPPGSDFEFVTDVLDCSSEPASQRCFPAMVVPEGQLVVAGDNRSNSRDSLTECRGAVIASACLLTVGEESVVGTVVFRWAPLNSFGPI